jgi:peptide/nickel transport system permease protein/peptide/nickel transport system substrate-binding protein
MDQAKSVYKLEERRALYQKIDEIIQQEAVDVPLYVAPVLEGMSTNVEGYQSNLLGKPAFRGVWLRLSR